MAMLNLKSWEVFIYAIVCLFKKVAGPLGTLETHISDSVSFKIVKKILGVLGPSGLHMYILYIAIKNIGIFVNLSVSLYIVLEKSF